MRAAATTRAPVYVARNMRIDPVVMILSAHSSAYTPARPAREVFESELRHSSGRFKATAMKVAIYARMVAGF